MKQRVDVRLWPFYWIIKLCWVFFTGTDSDIDSSGVTWNFTSVRCYFAVHDHWCLFVAYLKSSSVATISKCHRISQLISLQSIAMPFICRCIMCIEWYVPMWTMKSWMHLVIYFTPTFIHVTQKNHVLFNWVSSPLNLTTLLEALYFIMPALWKSHTLVLLPCSSCKPFLIRYTSHSIFGSSYFHHSFTYYVLNNFYKRILSTTFFFSYLH